MTKIVGTISMLAGAAGLAWLIAGANGALPQAQQFEFAAGIPITLLCALAATAMLVIGGACLFGHRLRRPG
jgi:hypothetical protein